MQAAEYFDEEATVGAGRRIRIYRQLLLTPAYNAATARPEDFAYLRNMHKRLREELESHTGLQFELYKDCALLVSPERNFLCQDQFPQPQSGLHAVMLHFANYCRERRATGGEWPERLSRVEFEKLAGQCREQCGSGWIKEYRELSLNRLAAGLLAELRAWKMADADPETGLIELCPPLWRLAGRYPGDYRRKQPEDEKGT